MISFRRTPRCCWCVALVAGWTCLSAGFAAQPNVVYSGPLPNDPHSDATVIQGAYGLAAAVRSPALGRVLMLPTDAGESLVQTVDAASLLPCGGRCAAQASLAKSVSIAAGSANPYGCDDGSVIDIMIVYTAAAKAGAGGATPLEASLDLAVAETNAAFSRSQINTQLRLVHTAEVAYAETGLQTLDGPRLVDPNDGFLDEVHALRDEYGADCASLVVETFSSGGIGYFPHPSLTGIGASGFSILRRENLPYILAHEFGHNAFCAHDRAHAPDPPFADYSYGYIEPSFAWQTIMAVSEVDYIQYYANPNVNWPGPTPPKPGPTGIAIGQPNASDVAATINQTRLFVANFRPTRIFGLPAVLYVDASASPGGDGTSWQTAFVSLDEALCTAAGSNGDVSEIWVAAGTYTPQGGDRSATFRMASNLIVRGGFSGDETHLSQRDLVANPTTLSGDIGVANDPNDNCYHVVTFANTNASAVLDGCTITGGFANGAEPDDGGAGVNLGESAGGRLVYCNLVGNTASNYGGGLRAMDNAAVTLENCRIAQNTVLSDIWRAGGGGLYAENGAALTLSQCVVEDNEAFFGAGLALFYESSADLSGCTIAANQVRSGGEGGGLYAYSFCEPSFFDCVLEDNAAELGGAVCTFYDCVPAFERCIVRGNTADVDGGGLYAWSNCNAQLTSTLLSGNHATSGSGGAVAVLFGSDAVLTNVTMIGNTAGFDAGGFSSYMSNPQLSNSLLWANTRNGVADENAQLLGGASTIGVNDASIQGWTGGLGGTGNDGNDPLLLDADGLDDTFGTADDNARLSSNSPARDTGDVALVPVGSLADLDQRRRIVGASVDRGAYEFVLPGDLDGDGAETFDDAALLFDCVAGPAVTPNPGLPLTTSDCLLGADVDLDGDVDLADVATLMPQLF